MDRRTLLSNQLTSLLKNYYPQALELTGKKEPTDGLQAKFSLHYCAAVALMADGRRPFVAGLAFAAALNVKLIPLAVLPAVALLLPDVRTMMRFGAGLALAQLTAEEIDLQAETKDETRFVVAASNDRTRPEADSTPSGPTTVCTSS